MRVICAFSHPRNRCRGRLVRSMQCACAQLLYLFRKDGGYGDGLSIDECTFRASPLSVWTGVVAVASSRLLERVQLNRLSCGLSVLLGGGVDQTGSRPGSAPVICQVRSETFDRPVRRRPACTNRGHHVSRKTMLWVYFYTNKTV